MGFKFKKKSLLMTYIISSCIIFIIPTVILVTNLYFSNIVELEDDIEKASINRMVQVKDAIDMKFKDLDLISIKISQDYSTSKFYMSSGIAEEMSGIAEIAKYKELNGFVDDILLYFRNDDYIYSADGRSNFDTMFNLIYQYPANVRYDVINNLKSTEFPIIIKSEEVLVRGIDKSNIITYLYPISKDYEKKDLTVTFIVSHSSILSVIKEIFNNEYGDVYILNENNKIIGSTGNREIKSSEINLQLFSGVNKDGVYIKKFDGSNYVLTSAFSQVTGIKFVSVLNKSQFFSEVTKSRISLAMLISSLSLVGLILIGFAASNSYKGIRRIKNKMDNYSTSNNQYVSEIDQIIDWMDTAIEKTEKIEDEYQMKHRIVRDQIVEMLLKGEISNIGNIKSIDLGFIKNMFSVTVISPVNNKLTLGADWNVSELVSAFEKFDNIHVLEMVLDNVTSIIVSETSAEKLMELQVKVVEVIRKLFTGNPVKIGIGKTYNDLSYLNNSFFEAQIALEQLVDKNNNILKYEDVIFEKEGEAYWNLNEEQAKFIQCVKYGNLEGAKLNLDVMLDTINANETSYLFKNLAYLDIINTLIKVCKNNKIEIDQEDVAELSNLSNYEQIQEKLEMVLEHIMEKRHSNQEQQSNQIINNILYYIDENFKSSDISLESVADHFGLSTHFLSRVIKEHLDKNFTDYLVNLRMQEFKKLVLETDKPIKEIIPEVGYIDISSFVRKFKKIEGVTPGAYRKMMKNE